MANLKDAIEGWLDINEMHENDLIVIDGTVTECFPKHILRVDLDNGSNVLAFYPLSRSNIKILPGDRVRVELKPEDLTQGRVTYRYRKKS